MLAPDELKRRIDAARTLRGLRQVDIAALVESDGHGKHDVGRLERGDVHLTPSLRRSLAHHLGVPETWFTEPDMDQVLIAPDAETQLDRLEETLSDMRAERERVATEIRGLLDQQTDLLNTIRTLVERLGIPDGVTLQDHVLQTVRDAAARSQPPGRKAQS